MEDDGELGKIMADMKATEQKIQEESALPSDHRTPSLPEKVT